MLSEQAANLREGFLFGVVETKSFLFLWFEFCEGFAQLGAGPALALVRPNKAR